MNNFVNLLDIVYPVGSIYHSMNATSPANSVGGTWTKIKTFLYGADTAKETGGEAMHTLTIDEMPKHNHRTIDNNCLFNSNRGASRTTVATGTTATFSQSYFTVTDSGGGQHTTTYRPTQPASSGIAQLKSKRGSVCLTTLTSWILSTPLGQYLSQIRQSHQQIQLAGHGQNSIVTRSFAAERLVLQVETIKELWQQLICRQMYGLREVLVKHYLETQRPLVPYLIKVVDTASKLCVSLIEKMTCIHTHLLTTALNTGLLTSISAQPSYVLGGVA